MDIADIKAQQANVDVEGEISSLDEPRTVTTARGPARVVSGKLKDNTGEIILSLWNDQIDQVSVGDRIKITKGYVREYRGELQLSTGKFGSLEVLEKQKGILGAVAEHNLHAATKDSLEEAEALSGISEKEPPVNEAVTADNIVEAEELAEEKKENTIVEEDVIVEEEDIVDE